MNTTTFIGLVNNAALLVVLGLLYDTFVLSRHFKRSIILQTITGVILGIMGIAVMLNAWEFMPGLIFDTRSVLLGVGGLFFGEIPTMIAVGITGLFRLYQGGPGAWTGAAVILTSGAIGLAWRHKRQHGLENISLRELYSLGIVVHIAMLLWMLSLPWPLAMRVLSKISLPVITIYPVGTVLLGKLMVDQLVRKRAEEALQASESRLKRAEIVAKIGNWEFHIATNRVYASEGARRVYGLGKTEWSILEVQKIPLAEYRPLLDKALKSLIEEGNPYDVEFKIQRPIDGQILAIHSIAEYDAQHQIVFGILQDITERKQMEEQIQTSLEEKTVLLRELYHRTKNTMQVIVSMLMLRATYTGDERIIALSQEIEAKIHAMSLVHQKLYQAQHLSRINMREYLHDLVIFLMSSYGVISKKVTYRLDIEPLEILIDTAIPCGLVTTELLSNALKYAFPGDRTGTIHLRLFRSNQGELTLIISDNGVGVPADFDLVAAKSLGIQTIINLVQHQLQGRITWDTRQGVTCQICLKDNLYTERV
ncbi:signal transduction histidine kinase [Candidatus Vecturithrix granuli]|uniref:histidine kinase n=1 Tax=Vecturithrix granuli TaxID=1499967 RepID=A0A081C274_VECG1|nr:signal transduction histidine kinase [Candidatus Vecturithrix granuli]